MKRNKKVATVELVKVTKQEFDSKGYLITQQEVPSLVSAGAVPDLIRDYAEKVASGEPHDWKVYRLSQWVQRNKYFAMRLEGYSAYGDGLSRVQVRFGFLDTRFTPAKWAKEGEGEGSTYYSFHEEATCEVLATRSKVDPTRVNLEFLRVSTYTGGEVRNSLEGLDYLHESVSAVKYLADSMPSKNRYIDDVR